VQPAYSHLIGDLQLKDFPMANFITTNTFFLGTSPVITEEQISYIKEMVDSFMRNYHE
jgi:dTDP-4-amino-4,6-dideoxygalactose transaminase